VPLGKLVIGPLVITCPLAGFSVSEILAGTQGNFVGGYTCTLQMKAVSGLTRGRRPILAMAVVH
jgi:hypothetical protein